jgi:hypothetical protein
MQSLCKGGVTNCVDKRPYRLIFAIFIIAKQVINTKARGVIDAFLVSFSLI